MDAVKYIRMSVYTHIARALTSISKSSKVLKHISS